MQGLICFFQEHRAVKGCSHYTDEDTETQEGHLTIQRAQTQLAETGLVSFSLHQNVSFYHERNILAHIDKTFTLPFSLRTFDSCLYDSKISAGFEVWFTFKILIPVMAFWLLDPPINLPSLSHNCGWSCRKSLTQESIIKALLGN